jgi:extracellular factor (EF) 3-hydroxypalmitic acid methyl ester biosynthesis protein
VSGVSGMAVVLRLDTVESAKEKMKTEAEAMVDRAVQRFLGLREMDHGSPECMREVSAATEEVCMAATAWLEHGGAVEGLDEKLREVIAQHMESPFVRRLRSWPRGYAGDFETVEYMLSGRVQAEPGSLGYWIESVALQSAMAEQHRNKIAAQSRWIAEAAGKKRGARILVLASGGAADLTAVSERISETGAVVVLNDSDAEALAFARARHRRIGSQIRCVHGNALGSIRKLQAEGPFDLVLAGGLFDYLDRRRAEFLAANVAGRLLGEGGTFCFTNIVSPNPYKTMLEVIGRWRLIERSETEAADLLAGIPDRKVCVEIERDATRLALLVRASWN